MDLINATPVPATIARAKLFTNEDRFGTVTAKASFHWRRGRLELDTQHPVPLLYEEVRTPLGLVPRDDLPRRDDGVLEVVFLGAAKRVEGAGRRVALRVGDHERSLLVFPDRTWAASAITTSRDAVDVPLSDERAFGGRALVEVDREAYLEVQDPTNPYGRGFDVASQVNDLDVMLRCPPGYPRFDQQRPLANLEQDEQRVRTPSDAPRPVYWSAVPMETALHARRRPPGSDERLPPSLHRAHPDWVVPSPRLGAALEIAGVLADGHAQRLELPRLRVWVDYVSGPRTGARELALHALCIYFQEQRLTMLYRASFSFTYAPDGERAMRLRLDEAPDRRA